MTSNHEIEEAISDMARRTGHSAWQSSRQDQPDIPEFGEKHSSHTSSVGASELDDSFEVWGKGMILAYLTGLDNRTVSEKTSKPDQPPSAPSTKSIVFIDGYVLDVSGYLSEHVSAISSFSRWVANPHHN